MQKQRIVAITKHTVEHCIPEEVSQWIQKNVVIVVDDLSDWELSPAKNNTEGIDLLGIFGFEVAYNLPVIGLNHKTIKSRIEAINTTKHEIAHAWLWHLCLPNGERVTNKLVKEWLIPDIMDDDEEEEDEDFKP